MATHVVGTRDEWMTARLALLASEKAHTRRGDELARQRQALPWVPVEEAYRFDTEGGEATLADLFQGRSQLLVYHFMFGPEFKAGCPSCSAIADGFEGITTHLAEHDVTLTAVSRAPLPALLAYRQRMGWTFPWASSASDAFNYDFNVSFTEAAQRDGSLEYNYTREGRALDPADLPPSETLQAEACGTDALAYTRERPGMSAFAMQDGRVHHTYSTYARGVDALWGMFQWLDRAPLGRNESTVWWRRHDEYRPRQRR